MIEVWFDGAVEPVNPGGWGGYGAAIYRDSEKLHEISGVIQKSPETSNNVAEYRALIEALSWLVVHGYAEEEILIRGDSRLVIEQMWGTWKIKAGLYAPLARQCKAIVARFSRLRGRWVPREENGPADELSKRELKRIGVGFRIQPESKKGVVKKTTPDSDPRARHSWERTDVEVPWSSVPGHLYTCRKCGTTRQSIPTGHFYVQEFTAPGGTVTRGKTPPCGGPPTIQPQAHQEAMTPPSAAGG